MPEVWMTVAGWRKGKRYARRHELAMPIVDFALGQYERMSTLAVREVAKDMLAELDRRGVPLEVSPVALPTQPPRRAPAGYNPMQSQITRPGGDQ